MRICIVILVDMLPLEIINRHYAAYSNRKRYWDSVGQKEVVGGLNPFVCCYQWMSAYNTRMLWTFLSIRFFYIDFSLGEEMLLSILAEHVVPIVTAPLLATILFLHFVRLL